MALETTSEPLVPSTAPVSSLFPQVLVKHLYLLGCVLAVAASCVPGPDFCGPSKGVVSRILDGDTIELETGEIIRYLLVDTPEISHNSSEVAECFADEAKQFNEDLVAGQTVTLAYATECTDRFGRTLAYVSVAGREVNALLVERGFACVLYIPPNGSDRRSEFETLESLAKQEGRGLWGPACENENNPC